MNHFLKQSGITLAVLVFMIPAFAHAADCLSASLININTADAATLDKYVPGIGPAKAGYIVSYRDTHGVFAQIADILNVTDASGVHKIYDTEYKEFSQCITVGDTSSSKSPVAVATATSTPSGGAPSYVPPPSLLVVDIGQDRTAFLDVPLVLTAAVKSKSGSIDTTAVVVWSFGDGSAGEGVLVQKTYRYPGTYLVTATATDAPTIARSEVTITVKSVAVHVASITGEGITLTNDSAERLDLSKWRLTAGTGIFIIPSGTTLLPHMSVLFSNAVTNLPIAFDASLVYPDGVMATRYLPPAAPALVMAPASPEPDVQPVSPQGGSSQIQAVESIISISVPSQAHVEAVNAPAAAMELAAAGAVFASSSPIAPPVKPAAGLLRSPWTYGLFGIIALAGGAFILL